MSRLTGERHFLPPVRTESDLGRLRHAVMRLDQQARLVATGSEYATSLDGEIVTQMALTRLITWKGHHLEAGSARHLHLFATLPAAACQHTAAAECASLYARHRLGVSRTEPTTEQHVTGAPRELGPGRIVLPLPLALFIGPGAILSMTGAPVRSEKASSAANAPSAGA